MKNTNSPSEVSAPKRGLFTVVALVSGLVIGVTLGFFLKAESKVAEDRLPELLTQVEDLQLALQTQQIQQTLDQATQQALEQNLHAKQDEIGLLREQLAFYEHLLPVSGQAAVQVRALELTPQDQVLQYRLLLQRPAGLERFKGHMQFTAQGTLGAESVNIVLNTAGTEPVDRTEIEFDQFLRLTGLLQQPKELKIHAVTLTIYQGQQLRATYKLDLDSL